MGDFFSFRRMITPIIIKIVFWGGVVAAVVVGLGLLADGNRGAGLAVVILGPLAVRIYCELLILFFRMNETLTDIRNDLARNGVGAQRPVPVAGQASRTPVLQPAAGGTDRAIAATPSEPE
jgi:hypothetical protein